MPLMQREVDQDIMTSIYPLNGKSKVLHLAVKSIETETYRQTIDRKEAQLYG